MTKNDIVRQIAWSTHLDRRTVLRIIDSYIRTVKQRMSEGNNIYFREFGTFVIRKRAQKQGRDITRGLSIPIPEHNHPSFRPSKYFVKKVAARVKVN
jgi:DNA-binding protein HU-beta